MTPQQVASAITRVHEARREAWPTAEEFMDAPIKPMAKLAWAVQWGKAREGWIATVEDAVQKFPLVPDSDELDLIVADLIDALERSAQAFEVEMMKILDE